MRVTVLGCGAAYPRPGGACSGYLVEGEGATVWLDAGNGTFSRLQGHVDWRDVDALVLSHAHDDHVADVIPFMYARGLDEPALPPLPVYGSADVSRKLLAGLSPSSRDVFGRAFDFRGSDRAFSIRELDFEPFRTVHPVETYGFRVADGNRTFVYTADSAFDPELVDACGGADLLLAESTFVGPAIHEDGIHMYAREAGELATKAGAHRLLLTHVWATFSRKDAVDEAQVTYDGPVEAALEGATYDV